MCVVQGKYQATLARQLPLGSSNIAVQVGLPDPIVVSKGLIFFTV